MTQKFFYPQAEYVIAWMQGKLVQYKDERGHWITLTRPEGVRKMPHFYRDCVYRIVEPSTRMRIGLVYNVHERVHKEITVHTLLEETNVERLPNFSHWITPWTEQNEHPQA